MSVLHLAHRHRPAVYLATILITLGGLWALFTLPAGIYPEVAFPRIIVLAKGGTFDAGNMTVAVTRPLEEAMSGVIDLRRIRSKTIRGGVEISRSAVRCLILIGHRTTRRVRIFFGGEAQ